MENLTESRIDTMEKLIPEIEEYMVLYEYQRCALNAALDALKRIAAYEATNRNPEELQRLVELQEKGRLVELPVSDGQNVFAKASCGEIYMRYDDDWEHGTGVMTCPFENECRYIGCSDHQSQILETAVRGILIGDGEIMFYLNGLTGEYRAADIEKLVWFSRKEAEKALEEQK